jgi:hypothetical protein
LKNISSNANPLAKLKTNESELRYDILSTPKHEFQGVEEDVNALEWLPNSAHELMAAT